MAQEKTDSQPIREPATVLAALEIACARHPSQRVMQVVVNALGPDPFYVEDDMAAERLLAWGEPGQTWEMRADPGIEVGGTMHGRNVPAWTLEPGDRFVRDDAVWTVKGITDPVGDGHVRVEVKEPPRGLGSYAFVVSRLSPVRKVTA